MKRASFFYTLTSLSILAAAFLAMPGGGITAAAAQEKPPIFNTSKGGRPSSNGSASGIRPFNMGGAGSSAGVYDNAAALQYRVMLDQQEAQDAATVLASLHGSLEQVGMPSIEAQPLPAGARGLSGSGAAAQRPFSTGAAKMVYDPEKQKKKGEERKKRWFNFR